LMRDLLSRGNELGLIGRVRRLVLQPNVGEAGLRTWLRQNGWMITLEQWLEEDGYVYPVITAEPQQLVDPGIPPDVQDSLECLLSKVTDSTAAHLRQNQEYWIDLFGASNIHKPSSAWGEKWRRELYQMKQMMQSLAKAESAEALARQKEVVIQSQIVQEVLQWLQPQDNLPAGLND
jgi:tRNA (adenine22-N1)-methyltransferase